MSKKVLIIFIVALVAVAGTVYYFSYQMGYREGKEFGRLMGEISAGTLVENPLGEMPSVNPFEKIINPFKELYKNPFK